MRLAPVLMLALIAVVALSVLGVQVLLPRYVADVGRSPHEWQREFDRGARREMASIALSLRRFARATGQLPLHLDEVADLSVAHGDRLEDLWGSAYRYEIQSKESFILVSAGPDRAFDTVDDLRHVGSAEDLALEAAVEDLRNRAEPLE